MSQFLTEAQAVTQILAKIKPFLPLSEVPLSKAVNRFSTQNWNATIELPSFDQSSMDGYALGSCAAPNQQFKIIGEQPAGKSLELVLESDEAIEIFTGAPLPKNTVTVVMQEEIIKTIDATAQAVIEVQSETLENENIRRKGEDLCLGQSLVQKGDKWTPARLALIASQGISKVSGYPSPKIGIITTGNELKHPDNSCSLLPGEIFETNGILLQSLVAEMIGLENVTIIGHACDHPQSLDVLLKKALQDYDLLITTGGVSVGKYDLVKLRLEALGAVIDFWRVNVKPGKPFAYGQGPQNASQSQCHIFCLPGNSISTFVSFLLFVKPAILKLIGANDDEIERTIFEVPTSQNLNNPGDRPHYLRGRIHPKTHQFVMIGLQASHAIAGLSQSQVLAKMEPHSSIRIGEKISCFFI